MMTQNSQDQQSPVSRRDFLAATAVGAAGVIATGSVVQAAPIVEAAPMVKTVTKTKPKSLVVGEGDFRYEVQHAYPQLPDKFTWQTTHNVAIDNEGLLYVIHQGLSEQKEHPSIFVFDADGKYVRSFGTEFQGGGHGIEVRTEGSEQFLYVCAYTHLKTFAKLTLKGKIVWQKFAPMEAGCYAKGEDTNPQKGWGRDHFLPTNFAFLDDGEFLLADGYGSYMIHRYDKNANYVSSFGGVGKEPGKFNLPHGLWVDRRQKGKPQIVVADRASHQLQYFTLEGKHIKTQKHDLGLPANIDTWKNLMVVPELKSRITILDENDKVVARLGDDAERVGKAKKPRIRETESLWKAGKFIHPHDACFDSQGNIFVAEWVKTGRITKLKHIS